MKKSLKNTITIISSLVFMSFIFFAFTPGDQKPWNIPAKYKSMKNPVKSDPTSINAGKAIYAKHCKSCHGAKGLGDGPKATTLKAKIPSFATKEFKSQVPGETYYKAIIGMDEMPNFEKKILDESERWSLVNYLGSF
jgi:mono/diheme cytochrome c family protein